VNTNLKLHKHILNELAVWFSKAEGNANETHSHPQQLFTASVWLQWATLSILITAFGC
jgi:hypothetical protein